MIPRLWYVTDGARGTGGRPLEQVIPEAATGGVEGILLREPDRTDRELEHLIEALAPLRRRGLRVVVSRRLDLARALELDGVQLTADSVPVAPARDWLGPDRWIGYSAHSQPEAERALREGADYVMLSPVFATDSKPGAPPLGLEALARAAQTLPGPVVALGGVTPDRTRGILAAQAWGVAAVSAIGAAADVERAAQAFRRTLSGRSSCT